MGRVCHGPSLLWAEMSRNLLYNVRFSSDLLEITFDAHVICFGNLMKTVTLFITQWSHKCNCVPEVGSIG